MYSILYVYNQFMLSALEPDLCIDRYTNNIYYNIVFSLNNFQEAIFFYYINSWKLGLQ